MVVRGRYAAATAAHQDLGPSFWRQRTFADAHGDLVQVDGLVDDRLLVRFRRSARLLLHSSHGAATVVGDGPKSNGCGISVGRRQLQSTGARFEFAPDCVQDARNLVRLVVRQPDDGEHGSGHQTAAAHQRRRSAGAVQVIGSGGQTDRARLRQSRQPRAFTVAAGDNGIPTRVLSAKRQMTAVATAAFVVQHSVSAPRRWRWRRRRRRLRRCGSVHIYIHVIFTNPRDLCITASLLGLGACARTSECDRRYRERIVRKADCNDADALCRVAHITRAPLDFQALVNDVRTGWLLRTNETLTNPSWEITMRVCTRIYIYTMYAVCSVIPFAQAFAERYRARRLLSKAPPLLAMTFE